MSIILVKKYPGFFEHFFSKSLLISNLIFCTHFGKSRFLEYFSYFLYLLIDLDVNLAVLPVVANLSAVFQWSLIADWLTPEVRQDWRRGQLVDMITPYCEHNVAGCCYRETQWKHWDGCIWTFIFNRDSWGQLNGSKSSQYILYNKQKYTKSRLS